MAGAISLRAAFLLQPTVRKPSIAPPSVPSCLPAFPSKKFPRGSEDGDNRRSFRYFSMLMRRSRVVMKAEDNGAGAGAVVLEDKPEAPNSRKLSPLKKGGTLTGDKAEGKDPSAAALGLESTSFNINRTFQDSRWKNGTWDLGQFAKEGKVDWDAVIDAEAYRRKWLENNPEASSNDEPVTFDTSIVPWWAWVKRFHLPEAERLNGRAAMIGFLMTYLVDSLTGIGLVDQMGSFWCKLLLFIAVIGVLLIRENEDLITLKQILEETAFYDKQWQATWQDEAPESSGKE